MQRSAWNIAKTVLQHDGVIVALTDTIFGILGSALSQKVVSRIYKLKERDLDKPFIILVTKIESLADFGIKNYREYEHYLKPKTSVIIPVSGKKFEYLHRGKQSLAFRVIGKRNRHLHTLIGRVGPLVAPSANPQGMEPARTVTEAKAYFGEHIDLYIAGSRQNAKPSKIVSFTEGALQILRK